MDIYDYCYFVFAWGAICGILDIESKLWGTITIFGFFIIACIFTKLVKKGMKNYMNKE